MRCIVDSETDRECEACGAAMPAGFICMMDEITQGELVPECDSCLATVDPKTAAALWGARAVAAQVLDSGPGSS